MRKVFLFLFLTKAVFIAYSQVNFHADTMKCEAFISNDSLKTLQEAYEKKSISINENGDTLYKMCATLNPPDIIGTCQYRIKEGYNKIYYETGTLQYEGYYRKIKKGEKVESGYFIYYFENGNKKEEGAFIKGKKEGLWKEYSESGKIHSEEIYKKGLNNGFAIIYFDNGQIKMKGSYVSDKKTERFIIRYLLHPRTRKTGKWTYYNRHGKKTHELIWTRNNNYEMQKVEDEILGFK